MMVARQGDEMNIEPFCARLMIMDRLSGGEISLAVVG